ncbi:MAG: Uma2 family endonuclease [Candidatus Latescibacteria bacterium]|nr:Uma2 family endonuclease [Candidatus Latescibacterota bacterium]
MSVQAARRHFKVAEYYRMAAAGIFSEDDRVELIEGEVLEMSPIGIRHAACVNRLNALFNQRAGQTAIVAVQNPIHLDDYSEPQPDLSLLKPRGDFYAQHHPNPDEILLIVEVADTSVAYDRDIKIPLYARAGIPQVWLVHLPDESVEVYAQPSAGAYRQLRHLRRGESLQAAGVPALVLQVDELLG